MQADEMREKGLKAERERERFCACVMKCWLPAVKCVVLLFQSKFSLLDLNHLPGQILWFPADRNTQDS